MPVSDPATAHRTAPLQALVYDRDEYVDIFVDLLSFLGDDPGPDTWATTSAVEARRRATRASYDVIVAARESEDPQLLLDIRRHQPGAVLVVTSASPLTARETTELFAAGADDVVVKPFHPSIVVARVNRLVESRAQLRGVASAALVSA